MGWDLSGSVSATGRGSVSPGMALSMGVTPCSCSLGLFAVLLHHGPCPCPSSLLPSPLSPRLWSPALSPLGQPCFEGSPAWDKSAFHVGIWAGRVLQGRETATSNPCPSFHLHAKDGEIVFPLPSSKDSCLFLS